jgi:hypothetical protein
MDFTITLLLPIHQVGTVCLAKNLDAFSVFLITFSVKLVKVFTETQALFVSVLMDSMMLFKPLIPPLLIVFLVEINVEPVLMNLIAQGVLETSELDFFLTVNVLD